MNLISAIGPGLLACSLLFTACVKDKPSSGNPDPVTTDARRVLVANEGVFGNGNASLSYINTREHSIINDVYTTANQTPLGDVLQSITVWEDKLYLVVNNSNKIVVVDKHTFKRIHEISVSQPRYLQIVDAHTAYITSMYGRRIFVLDPDQDVITDTINTSNKNNEGIYMLQDKVYVCPWDTGSNYIYELNPADHSISRQIPIGGYAPTQVLADKNQHLWVIAGNPTMGKQASITQIDPVAGTILQTHTFHNDEDLIKPTFNPTRDTLYFIGVDYQGNSNSYNGIYRMPISGSNTPQVFIPAVQLQYFWGLGIDPQTGDIYIGDPKGFIQKGSVLVYRPDGSLIQSYDAELGPGYFHFE